MNLYQTFDPFEIDNLRMKAMSQYEQCLVDRSTAHLVQFIEQQIHQGPLSILLFENIANDLQQRLFSLRLHHFDVRKNIIDHFWERHYIDLTPLMPADALPHFHHVSPDDLLALLPGNLTADERDAQRKHLLTAWAIAQELQTEIDLTAELLQLVTDWMRALSVNYAQQHLFWHIGIALEPGTYPIH